jgi:hypothetical protein
MSTLATRARTFKPPTRIGKVSTGTILAIAVIAIAVVGAVF